MPVSIHERVVCLAISSVTNDKRATKSLAICGLIAMASTLIVSIAVVVSLQSSPRTAFNASRTASCETWAPCSRDPLQATSLQQSALPGRHTVPLATLALTPTDHARALNARAPVFKGPIVAARAFRFAGSATDRARAVTCLAAAQLYEAGYDETDQKAVAQVILNRARHPAFPHTICGVVFEGSSRATGCQFTFTCDGSLARRYPQSAWMRARLLAARMIDGEIDARVGWATHYHTDWVYPYWSPSLEKLAAIRTHQFFKWRGNWGTAAAFAAIYQGSEPLIRQLHGDSDTPPLPAVAVAPEPELDPTIARIPPPMADAPLPDGIESGGLVGATLKLVHPDGGGYGLLLKPGTRADDAMAAAMRLCLDKAVCRVLGWSSVADIPRGFPIPASAQSKLSFSYVRYPAAPAAQISFDCARFPEAIKKRPCLDR